MNASAQAPAADIDQLVERHETLIAQKFEMLNADRGPHPADAVAVMAGGDRARDNVPVLGSRLNQTQNAMMAASATADKKFAASLS